MADPSSQPHQLPLLTPTQNNTTNHQQHDHDLHDQDDDDHRQNQDVVLDKTLQRLEMFLSFLGFNQSSILRFTVSWFGFLVIGVLIPVVILELSNCSGCEKYQIKDFELVIVGAQGCLAAVSLGCLSHNLHKYGIRRFLFVDKYSGHMSRFTHQYIQQIKDSLRLLVFWSLPCIFLKIVREVIRILYVHESWWLSAAILFALIISWSYVSIVTLTAGSLFHLVCNLQVIHFDDYAKLLERESDVLVFIEEHIRLRHHLSKISHRFRIFLILEFFIVTASQFVTLFQTTGYGGRISIINGGDFAVSAVVQVVGTIICLHAATKISHRAQGIASLASRWHALATCSSTDSSHLRGFGSTGNLVEPANAVNSLHLTYSESDLESVDYLAMSTSTQLASYMTSYHKRQAFVMYLQNNPGGITIFGWTVDRELINTIFFIELSLVTFVLGKTLVFTSN